MSELSRTLREDREFTFDPIDCRVRCLPHIYNICVQHTLDNYADADFIHCPRTWKNSAGKVIDRDSYVDSVRTDPIGCGRDVVCTVRSSGQRRTNFRQTILSGNEQEWFINDTGDIVKLPVVQLLHDVRTCWDSTYYMINRMRALRQVCDYRPEYGHHLHVRHSSSLGYRLLP
ncbi:hypothetical protein BU15DRAFT_56408 [Melanogaster broomeanus]|nr:hypothetical protein BU15DRAFT_56408 [Melanogaster broomeanus]